MTSDAPPFRAVASPDVLARFPSYRCVVLYAGGVRNGPTDERSDALLGEAERAARAAFEGPASGHPHVLAWRSAFSAFGSKPSSYLSSVEGLLKRILRGAELPRINLLVDAYNAVSVAHVLPIGGEDRSRLASDVRLRFAAGDEPFDDPASPGGVDHPAPGEVVWADDQGVTCRRWNWRQGLRTRLTEDTVHAYFVLERLDPYGENALDRAAAALMEHLERLSPGCALDRETLGGG